MASASLRLFRWQARSALRPELGAAATKIVLDSAEARYGPPPALARTASGRLNLQMGAYLLALRDALVEAGHDPVAANDLLARSLYGVMRRFYRPMDALAVAAHPRSKLARARWRERVSRRVFFKSPDWTMDEVRAPGAYGFDVSQCAMADFLRSRGELQFCRDVICRQDTLMAQGRGDQLDRRHTIAGGDDRCDFRYTRTA